MERNRSDSSSSSPSAADEMSPGPQGGLPTTAHRKTTFLNHDIMAEVARFVGVFGKDASSCFPLVDQKWYQALISIFDEWKEYQRGFGLPRSDWISESGSDFTFNYRAAVIDSLKRATEGDRSRVLMEPEQYVDYDSTTRLASPLPTGWTHIILARTGHLRSEQYRALWKPVLHSLSNEVQVSFLLVLPPPPIACAGLASSVSIDSCFLFGCHSLINVDLACLSSVTTIGDFFFSSCSSLTTIELAGLNSVYTIGHSFLGNCSSLTSLDLSGLSSVTRVGDDFLSSCTSLTSVDLAGLSSVTSIGRFFLEGSHLTHEDALAKRDLLEQIKSR